jgi:hypothetical protein
MTRSIENFGRNIQFHPNTIFEPRDLPDLLRCLNQVRGQQIRVYGSLHSWSPAAATNEVAISLHNFTQVTITHDEHGPLATIGAGCQIKRALVQLAQHNLTLPALGLISEQTIVGACSTATHGSGRHCLSHYITAVHLAHYDADTDQAQVSVIRDPDQLRAAKCSLGCLGVIVAVELRPRAKYRIEESLAIHQTLEAVLDGEKTYPLQQFYYLPWRGQFLVQQRRESSAPRSKLAWLYRVYWYLVVDWGLHLVLVFLVRILQSQRAVKLFFRSIAPALLIRGWRVVDDSAKHLIMEHELFRHIEIELFVRRSKLPEALRLLPPLLQFFDHGEPWDEFTRGELDKAGLLEKITPAASSYTHHYPICVRRVLPDDLFLSMSSGDEEDFYALSIISYAQPHQRAGFFQFAELLAQFFTHRFQARCHWGKYYPDAVLDAEQLYPDLPTFRTIAETFDRQRRFRNEWVNAALFSGQKNSSERELVRA